ncbi:MAG TPA: N-acetyl-gamma-glutamyl-phosphate reductase [Acidimicrobiales bacterium]|nr:N-acetyl-gamma-glutamyl-phosphate reductase [Acidimicrobiales bacterium]
MTGSIKVAVVGATGYTGVELLRLLQGHPDMSVEYLSAGASAGSNIEDLYPSLAGAYTGMVVEDFDRERLRGIDLVFLAMPHGSSMGMVGDLIDKVGAVVDLSADFRLKNPADYEQWYGHAHTHPELLERAALGIPELFRSEIESSKLIAAAGCYVTAASIALAPLARSGLIETQGVIVDAASGVSGAGHGLSATTHFSSANEGFSAYALSTHRHTPEIEQATGCKVLFTPHLAPMTRGILATCYARPAEPGATASDISSALSQFFEKEQFVMVVDSPPSTKHASGSNSAFLFATVDERTGWVIVLCALDNLVKGAAGQAIQCANLVLGIPEGSGLTSVGMYP